MKKSLIFILAMTLAVSTFTGCGQKKAATPTDNNTTQSTEVKKNTKPVVLKETCGKVATLNPHVYKTSAESDVFAYINAGLLKFVINEKGDNYEMVGVHATGLPTKSKDNLTWTFKLRDGLKWSDGEPINAETYVQSYKYLLDPKLKNYRANSLFSDVEVKGAKDYFEGKCEWDKVGVKAPDKNTLVIELVRPINDIDFYDTFRSGSVLGPVNIKVYEANMNAEKTETKYGTSIETTPCNGPYVLKEWVRDQNMVYEKNPDCPLSKLYTVDRIESRVVEDAATNMQLFEKGDIDYVGLAGADYNKYAEDPRVLKAERESVWSMFLNTESTTNPVIKDANFRKALFYGTDRNKIAKDVYKTPLPAPYYIATVFYSLPNTSYRGTPEAKALVPENGGYDTKKAKDYFDKAFATNGNKKITLEVQYFDNSENMKKMSELLEEEYENLFGKDRFDLILKATPWNVVYDNMEKGKFEAGFGAWGGGVFNPWSSMEVYTSDYASKNDRMRNKKFDELYNRTVKGDLVFNEKGRHEALVEMEKIMYEETQWIPIYQTVATTMFADKIKLKTNGKYVQGVGYGVLQSQFEDK